ncbi:[NiFe]-hydrogenase assembly chaperone HybE [Dechloromonas sp. TW-R-39-2]|uniref:[NiFe]-hydrogenase assembly chaperone HybE n=1 Tax=Dechloromonas sp. TW-R-39-2 TaxID=2654218 RepID=UPI00193E8F3B|nr:[NiFe]-hydrogenase assembly chaperone HybE [Dechloromonas sp. TW-R-39-2]
MTPIHAQDPALLLEEHFRQTAGQNGPLNPRLQVEAIGFSRYLGDWLGVVVTPDFVRLLLLPGGGSLWGDIPAGQRRYLELAGGTHTFFAEESAAIGPYQWAALVDSAAALPDMTSARLLALDGLRLATGRLPEQLPVAPAEAAPEVTRRGFFRRLAGKRP